MLIYVLYPGVPRSLFTILGGPLGTDFCLMFHISMTCNSHSSIWRKPRDWWMHSGSHRDVSTFWPSCRFLSTLQLPYTIQNPVTVLITCWLTGIVTLLWHDISKSSLLKHLFHIAEALLA